MASRWIASRARHASMRATRSCTALAAPVALSDMILSTDSMGSREARGRVLSREPGRPRDRDADRRRESRGHRDGAGHRAEQDGAGHRASRSCGQPGERISVPHQFFSGGWNRTWAHWGDPAKLFVHEWAKLRYGIALVLAGQKPKASEIFNTVQGADGAADLAHLWDLYTRQFGR